jgi:hypothetical protein
LKLFFLVEYPRAPWLRAGFQVAHGILFVHIRVRGFKFSDEISICFGKRNGSDFRDDKKTMMCFLSRYFNALVT